VLGNPICPLFCLEYCINYETVSNEREVVGTNQFGNIFLKQLEGPAPGKQVLPHRLRVLGNVAWFQALKRNWYPSAKRQCMSVPVATCAILPAAASGPNTVEAAAQVMAARCIQFTRSGVLNAALSSAQLAENLGLSMPARQLLLAVSAKMLLSARAKQRVERVARTLADLDACAAIAPGHVAEALQLRRAS
jgi:hypothetical protein